MALEKISRQPQTVWADSVWEISRVLSAGKRLQAGSFQQNLQNKSVSREGTFLQTFLIIHVGQFSVPTFCGSFWKPWRESPSSWQCVVIPRTRKLSSISFDENCIEFEFQTDRNYYVDLRPTYLALKLKFVKSHGYETHNTKENKKEHKEKAKADAEATAEEEEQEVPVLLVTHVKNILLSIFSNVEVYINNQQI